MSVSRELIWRQLPSHTFVSWARWGHKDRLIPVVVHARVATSAETLVVKVPASTSLPGLSPLIPATIPGLRIALHGWKGHSHGLHLHESLHGVVGVELRDLHRYHGERSRASIVCLSSPTSSCLLESSLTTGSLAVLEMVGFVIVSPLSRACLGRRIAVSKLRQLRRLRRTGGRWLRRLSRTG